MKVIESKEVPTFKPVTVVFESQAEIDYITALLGSSSSHIACGLGLSGLNTGNLYDQFANIASRVGTNGCDNLTVSLYNPKEK